MKNYRQKDGREVPRREELPAHDPLWAPFFDESIQNVLEPMRPFPSWVDWPITEQQRLSLLAFPIFAYEKAHELARDRNHWNKSDYLWAYSQDPTFALGLLSKLTDYVMLPVAKCSLARIAIETDCEVKEWPGDAPARSMLFGSGSADDWPVASPARLSRIAEHMRCKFDEHAKDSPCWDPENLDSIRQTLSQQRIRRKSLLKKWSKNFDARAKFRSWDSLDMPVILGG